MRLRHTLGRTAAAGIACVTLWSSAGCLDTSGLQFHQDHRLSFHAPGDDAHVRTPLTLRWSMKDFHVLAPGTSAPPSDDAGYFAVFVDRSPIRPGHTLADVGKGDPSCDPDAGCPNRSYLAAKGVYTVRTTSLRLDNVVPLSGKQDVQQHQATIVLLDSTGHRIGEAAWYRLFKLDRTPS